MVWWVHHNRAKRYLTWVYRVELLRLSPNGRESAKKLYSARTSLRGDTGAEGVSLGH